MIRSVEILVDLVARSSGRKLSANEQAEFDQAKNAVEALLSAGGQRVARVEIGPGLGYGDGPLYLPHNTREGGGFSAVFVPAWAESLRQVAALAHPVAEQRERERAACRSAEEALAARVRHLLAEEVANRDALASWSREARAIVATDQGVLTGDTAALLALPPPLATYRAARVVDDLLGGVVAQAADPRPDTRGDIVWLPAERVQPTLVDGTGSTLLDTGYAEGTPWAVVSRSSGEVVRIRLADLTATPLLTLDHDEQLLSLSAAGAVHAIAVSDADCGQIRFHGADGALVDLPAPAAPICEVPRRPTFGAVALSADGRQLAYTMITYRDDGIEAATEVLVRDLATGTDLVRRTVGQEGERITSLAYDNRRVVYLRQPRDGGPPTPELLDLAGEGRTSALPLPSAAVVSSVSFARQSLTGGGS